jgi:DNA polymerase-3 subunit beta
MKVITTKEALTGRLAMVAGAAEGGKTTPILGAVLLKAAGTNLSMLCSDTGVLARAISECQVGAEGSICVDTRRFGDLVRAIPDRQEVSLTLDKDLLIVRAGKSRFRLPTFPAADYPRMTVADGTSVDIVMPAKRLGDLIDRCAVSMASNDVRVQLNGMCFDLKDGVLALVATDGHRLTIATEKVASDGAVQVIAPRKTVLLARKLLVRDGDVKLTLRDRELQMSFADGSVLLTKGIDARFVDYQRVLPTAAEATVVVGSPLLRDQVSMLSAVTPGDEKNVVARLGVEVSFGDGSLTLKRGEDGCCEMPAEINPPIKGTLGINVEYLRDALATLGSASKVSIVFNGDEKAIIVTSAECEHVRTVVMPMKL